MAKRNEPRRARASKYAFGFGQLMLLSGALMNVSLCQAEAESQAIELATTSTPEQSSRELLLYLGEFDPELDPIELSQMGDPLEVDLESKTDAKTATEARADVANEPKK